ncbi:MAG: NAD(P)/FAD-dependent oxidoreductase, partial [Granulosicoccaceae bacterium]
THYLQSLIGSSAKTVVLGGGLLGLEAAAGLARQGTDVTVVHRHAILMNRQLDTEASRLLQARLESMGVRFRTAIEPTALQGDTRVEAVELANGEFLEADCVVQAAGIVANAELARASGLECDQGVLVDDYLRTNKPSVYALGECCEHQGVTVGLVAPIREQAKTLAKVLLGDISQPYRPTATSALLKVSGVQLFSAGDLRPQSPRAEEIVFKAPASASKGSSSYRKIIIHNRKLAGVVMFGDTSDSPWFLEKIQARTDIEDQRENLIFGRQFCA